MGRYALYGSKDYRELVEEFATRCHRCRRDVPHSRVEVTRRRTIFHVPLQQLGVRLTMVSCRYCGHESHIRDLPALASPTQIAKYTLALRAAVTYLLAASSDRAARDAAIAALAEHYSIFTDADLDADAAAQVDAQLDDALGALEVEAGPHITGRLLAQLVPVAAATTPTPNDVADVADVADRLHHVAERLNVSRHRLDTLVADALTS